MNEMRMNHHRGVVTNLVVAQNPGDQRPEGNSYKRYLYSGLKTGDRHKDGMCFIPPKAGTLDCTQIQTDQVPVHCESDSRY